MEYRIIATGILEPSYLAQIILDWYLNNSNQISSSRRSSITPLGTFINQSSIPQNHTYQAGLFSSQFDFRKTVSKNIKNQSSNSLRPLHVSEIRNLFGTSSPISSQPAITQTETEFEIKPGIRLRKISNLGELHRDYFFWQKLHVLIIERLSGHFHWQKLKENWNNPQAIHRHTANTTNFSDAQPSSDRQLNSTTDRLTEAARRALFEITQKNRGLFSENVNTFFSPDTISAFVAISTVTSFSPLSDVELAIGDTYFLGKEVNTVVDGIKEYVAKASHAQTENDLNEAAFSLANAVMTGGDVFFALINPNRGRRNVKKSVTTGALEQPKPLSYTLEDNKKLEKPLPKKVEKSAEVESSNLDVVHTALDVIGLIPVIGEVADGLNAVLYAAEGDLGNAAISAASMIPIVGDAASGGRLALKLGSNVAEATVKGVKKIDPPKGWITKPSKKGGGIIYQDPQNPHNVIRQMPGNPNSQHATQQKPYIIYKKNGVAYDVNGNPLPNASHPDAHIPASEFEPNNMPKFD